MVGTLAKDARRTEKHSFLSRGPLWLCRSVGCLQLFQLDMRIYLLLDIRKERCT